MARTRVGKPHCASALAVAVCLVALLLSGCASASHTKTSGASFSTTSSASSASAATSASNSSKTENGGSNKQSTGTETPEVDLDELAQNLPKKGLPEKYIDMSWLGEHDKTSERSGATTYYWQARNGTGDTVYSATCEKGVVTHVSKHHSASGYWPELRGLPDLYTTTPFKEEDEEPVNKYSPRDYDSAEDWEADTGGSIEEWDRQ